jgi:EAL domain-containing protein (putative c-di-GMP-specific phosphodiesterase class I)
MLVNRLESIEKSMYMLKHVGVQIAIKDFGVGYLSLQHLKRFPIDYLKIAPTLVHDITLNKENEAIVRMILALAKSLKIKVSAEGVESEKQKQLLMELGCYQMQGGLFSSPLPIDEFTQDKMTTVVSRHPEQLG